MRITNTLSGVANEYRDFGLNILPADSTEKRPVVDWKLYQTEKFQGEYNTDAIAIVCGSISNNVEVIDFDFQALAFDEWSERVRQESQVAYDLISQCVIERSQSGGRHLAYRIETTPSDFGNRKLCARLYKDDTLCGKPIQADKLDRRIACLIETRGEGGICLISPSKGYELIQGLWTNLPVLPNEIRDLYLRCATDLSDVPSVQYERPKPVQYRDYLRDSNDFDVADFLRKDDTARKILSDLNISYVYEDSQKEYWRRAGTKRKVSLTLDKDTSAVYCFSSNCDPIQPNRIYTPLQLLACVEYNDDVNECAKDVWNRIKGEDNQLYNLPFAIKAGQGTCISEIEEPPVQDDDDNITDPSQIPFPTELFQADGFISQFMQYVGQLSPKRQPRLNLIGCLATLSFLIGRKVECENGGSPCIYGIGISEPSTGKNALLQGARRLLVDFVQQNQVHDSFESVQGLQNVIRTQRCALLLQDEFGGYLKSINQARGNDNKTRLINEMLTLFSTYGEGVYYTGKTTSADGRSTDVRQTVESPAFAIYGTTNPSDFSESISGNFLKNGFAARLTYVYGEPNVKYDRSFNGHAKPSDELIEIVKEWKEFDACETVRPNIGVQAVVLEPVKVDSDTTRNYLMDCVLELEDKRVTSMECEDEERRDAANAFIGRLGEKLQRYTTLFCCSRVGAKRGRLIYIKQDVDYAKALIDYEYRLFKYLIKNRIASNEYEKIIQKAIEWIRARTLPTFTKSNFIRRFPRLEKTRREDVLETLIEREVITKVEERIGKSKWSQGKRTRVIYAICGREIEEETNQSDSEKQEQTEPREQEMEDALMDFQSEFDDTQVHWKIKKEE